MDNTDMNTLKPNCIITVSMEKILGKGEDAFYYEIADRASIAGVFDGCGGSGAQKYERFQGHSGAYMASRAVAGAVRDWYKEYQFSSAPDIGALENKIKRYLAICNEVGGAQSKLKGLMTKDFPTTAALFISEHLGKNVSVYCIWAGDSRCYYLSEDGLMQLTEDDLGGIEAMDNLSADGVLTNCISLSSGFKLHLSQFTVQKPGILFSASDGCFGYLSTPMEFEYLLEESLSKAENFDMWESNLLSKFQAISGDDTTLCGVVFGFDSYNAFKETMASRTQYVFSHFVKDIAQRTAEEKNTLWLEYRKTHNHFLIER